MRQWDVVVVGAGPAGLSAALVLGRACRRVLVCDTGVPRSWASKRMHAFLTRDGIAPAAFRRHAHRELQRYPKVVFRDSEVKRAVRIRKGGFRLATSRGVVTCRKLLIATGVLDHLPSIPGIVDYFGKSVFTCPYCDGWEVGGRALVAYGKGQRGLEMARALTAWTDDIALCTDGAAGLGSAARAALRANGIKLYEQKITGLEGRAGRLAAIVFKDGSRLRRTTLFFDMPSSGQSGLAKSLGCQFTRKGGVKSGRYEATSVPGVFVAGNIIRDVQLAIVAAAEGASAAFGINLSLTREDFERKATGVRRIKHPPVNAPRP
ncbi:MAG: NAD(P)/FAD-dependent oxidoreductase [Pseudomonadota bacterium]|nr:NAD(P)/FAD-dependent oxidoreductase [Pseudomonadota bacterium]